MKFNGQSYTIGFIESVYNINNTLTEQQSKTYLSFCKLLDVKCDDNIIKYIINTYPHLM